MNTNQSTSYLSTPKMENRSVHEGDLQVRRRESVMDYNFTSKGKYTAALRQGFTTSDASLSDSSDLTFDLKGDSLICPSHHQNKNIFLFADYVDVNPKFSKFSRICINCESEIKEEKGSIDSRLYDIVIKQNKKKIREIRAGQVEMGLFSNKNVVGCQQVLDDVVYPFTDELIDLVGTFESSILARFCESGNSSELENLKNFINQMKLDANGDPLVEGIGLNKDREREYISLAIFLIYFQGVNKKTISYDGVSESLKSHLLKIIKLRKVIVRNTTEWLRFLIGDFYDFVFTTEGLSVDNQFRASLNIEYPSEEDLARLKHYYEQIIRQKDEQISALLSEKDKHLQIIEELKRNMNNMKIEFENTLRTELQNWKTKFAEMESKYQNELRGLAQERDQLKQQIAMLSQKFEMEIRGLASKYENTLMELEQLKEAYSNLQIQFNQLRQDYERLKAQYEALKNENAQLLLKITSLNETLNNLGKDRDASGVQIATLTAENDKLRAELANLLTLKVTLEAQLAEAKSRYDDLAVQLNKLREELNFKNSLVQKFEFEIKHLNSNKFNSDSQMSALNQQVEHLKGVIAALNNQVEDLKAKIPLITERDNEISKLRSHISLCKVEWERLSESYDVLLADNRKYLEVNQSLVVVILELQEKIRRNNSGLEVVDLSIKQKIDILAKEAVTHQRIEVSSNNETVKKYQTLIDEVKSRLGLISNQNLNKSAVFANLSVSMESAHNSSSQAGAGLNVEVQRSTVVTNDYGMNSMSHGGAVTRSIIQQSVSSPSNGYELKGYGNFDLSQYGIKNTSNSYGSK